MRVAACIPTRGDVDLDEIYDSLPDDWDIFVWDNSDLEDLAVYARYAAIKHTNAPIIYTQDDDVVLDPESFDTLLSAYQPGVLTANMPQEFRHDFYKDHCLVGFGAIFDRDLPAQAFARIDPWPSDFFYTCDVVFTALTTRHLVDVPKRNLPWASDDNRMWRQPGHQASRSRTLQLARRAL